MTQILQTLYSERLILKPLGMEHLSEEYVHWMNDKEVIRYLESGGDYTFEKLRSFLQQQVEKEIMFWAIHLKDSMKHIGNIKIDPIDIIHNSGEYGIMMGDVKEWGKGYAKEASFAVMDFCFEVKKLHAITLGVVDANTSAVKMYERMGFAIYDTKENVGVYAGNTCNVIRMIFKNDE